MTLVEVLIAMGLGSLVLAGLASMTMFGSRSSLALVNYSDLDQKSRYALDVISKELREATAVVAFQTSASVKSLTFTNAEEGKTVTIRWDANNRNLVLTKTGEPPFTALTECDRWDFALYQRTPYVTPTNTLFYPATNSLGAVDVSLCKLIDMSWKCARTIMAQKVNTESVQAAQIVLRNKQ